LREPKCDCQMSHLGYFISHPPLWKNQRISVLNQSKTKRFSQLLSALTECFFDVKMLYFNTYIIQPDCRKTWQAKRVFHNFQPSFAWTFGVLRSCFCDFLLIVHLTCSLSAKAILWIQEKSWYQMTFSVNLKVPPTKQSGFQPR